MNVLSDLQFKVGVLEGSKAMATELTIGVSSALQQVLRPIVSAMQPPGPPSKPKCTVPIVGSCEVLVQDSDCSKTKRNSKKTPSSSPGPKTSTQLQSSEFGPVKKKSGERDSATSKKAGMSQASPSLPGIQPFPQSCPSCKERHLKCYPHPQHPNVCTCCYRIKGRQCFDQPVAADELSLEAASIGKAVPDDLLQYEDEYEKIILSSLLQNTDKYVDIGNAKSLFNAESFKGKEPRSTKVYFKESESATPGDTVHMVEMVGILEKVTTQRVHIKCEGERQIRKVKYIDILRIYKLPENELVPPPSSAKIPILCSAASSDSAAIDIHTASDSVCL